MISLRFGLFLLLALANSTAGAEPIFPDGLLGAYLQAGRDIATGKKRDDALAQLKLAINKHPDSRFKELAKRLELDIATSIDQAATRAKAGRALDDAPAEFLSESKMPLSLLAYPQNWKQALPMFLEAAPLDPAALVLKQGRKGIDSLLPRLGDDSPARAFDDDAFSDVPKIPRVSDLALHLIENLSLCEFNVTSGALFHELSPERRTEINKRIAEWLQQNRDKSVAEGIRDQLPHGDLYAQITMAENLIRIAGDASPADREHGLEVLRARARPADDYGSQAARVLAKYGDLSPVDWYYLELRKAANIRGRLWTHTGDALFYLADHGKRKEWELLRDIAVKDLEQETELPQRGHHAYVLGSLLNSKKCATVPYAIPLLGLGLNRTKLTGSRYINEKVGSQSFSTADKATEYLQKQTAQDFGYRVEGTDKERAAAIERAQKWWADEGEAKYTFEYIEQNLAMLDAGKKAMP